MTKINSINRKVLFILCACLCSIKGWAVDIHVGSQDDWNNKMSFGSEKTYTIIIDKDFDVDLTKTWNSVSIPSYKKVKIQGNEHTITFNGDNADISYIYGLMFSVIQECTLEVEKLNVDITGKITSNEDGLGGIIGYNNNSTCTFTNVHVKGGRLHAPSYVGGFIGSCEGPVSFYNCSVEGLKITATSENSNVGSLVGDVEKNSAELGISNLSIINCELSGISKVGGLVGFVKSDNTLIENVTTSGLNINVSSTSSFVGGLFGYVENTEKKEVQFLHVSSDANINFIGDAEPKYIGGIVGNVKNDAASNLWQDISYSGSIISSSGIPGESIGGIVGDGRGRFENVNVGTNEQFVKVDVLSANIGGIVGNATMGNGTLTFVSCHVFANISAIHDNGNKQTKGDYIGGFIGYSTVPVDFPFSEVNDVCSSFKGNISGGNYVGGIVGNNAGVLTASTNIHSGVRVLDGTIISGSKYVGGYFGIVKANVNIDKSSLTNVVINSSDGYAGGIIGDSYSYSTPFNIKNVVCSNITITSSAANARYLGGMIGNAKTVNFSDCSLLGCHVIMNGHTNYNSAKAPTCFGGYLGSGTGKFNNCIFGTESAPSYITFGGFDEDKDCGGLYIGGFVGENKIGALSFTGCSFYGYMQLTNREKACTNVGGFIGYCDIKQTVDFKDTSLTLLNSIRAVNNLGGFIGAGVNGIYTFDNCNVIGNGITLSAYKSEKATEYVGGLAGRIGGSNVSVNNSSVIGVNLKGEKYVGGFIGYAQQKSQFTGTCKFLGSSIIGTENVGGYVGYVYGKASFGNFTDKFMFTDEDHDVAISGTSNVGGFIGCLNDVCTISNAEMSARVSIASDNIAGGLVGLIDNDAKSSNVLNAVKCVNKANVSSVATAAGGIVGHVKTDAYIYDCSNSGAISLVNQSGEKYGVGGIVGSAINMSPIRYCANYGSVNAVANSAGGILGYSTSQSVLIDDCFNAGNIINANAGTGGIAGFFQGKISHCYNIGDIRTYPGILGKPGESNNITGEIYNCYSNAHVKIGGDNVIQSNAYVLGTDNKMLKSSVCYDDLCFKSGRLAYSLEMGSPSTTEDDIHFIQDLTTDERPYLVFEKNGCMAYPDDAADLIQSDPRQVVMSLTDVGRKYVREHIVYCGTIIRDTYDSKADTSSENVQGLTHKTHTDYFNLADDASQTHAATGNRHTDSFVDKNFTNYGTTNNNYMKVITGVIKPNDTAMNQLGGMFKANGIWANVEFADGKITNYLSAEANEIKITDAALNSKQGKTDCIPFDLYLPMDVIVNDESKISYTRKATSSLLSIELPFAVGSVKDSNGNDVTSEVSFGVFKGYTNDNDNPTLNFEAKTIGQFDGGYAPAGAYICEYTGTTPATLVFYGKDIDGNGAKVEKTYCPDAFRPAGCTLPERDSNASSENFYTHYTGGSGNVSILGYTSRYVMNSANWAHYYYLSKGMFYGAATQGGVFTPPFRSMIYFQDSEGPISQNGNSAKAATLSFIHFSPEDEDAETSVFRMEDIDADQCVDVYSVNGTKVRTGVASSNALEELPAGIYVVNGIKVVK